MAIRRYHYTEKPLTTDNFTKLFESLKIEGELYRHIFVVCRARLNEKFELLDHQTGAAVLVQVDKLDKKEAWVRLLEVRPIPELKRPWIHLCLSFPKMNTFEAILEKAVELGVKSLQPFVSDYSYFRELKEVPFAAKKQRWQKIIESASNQCGRGQFMELRTPVTFNQLVESFEELTKEGQAAGLFAFEGESTQSARDYLKQIEAKSPEEVWVFIGSEGGFSPSEQVKLAQILPPVSFGDEVLRVETACMVVVGVLKYELGLF